MIRKTGLHAIRKFPSYIRLLIDVLKAPILIYVAAVGNLFLLIGAAAFYAVETGVNPTVQHPFDAIWWAFSTVTTVGFGDIVPMTTTGRIIGIGLMLAGITSFVSFTALLVTITSARAAEEIVGYEARESLKLEQIAEALASLANRLDALEQSTRSVLDRQR